MPLNSTPPRQRNIVPTKLRNASSSKAPKDKFPHDSMYLRRPMTNINVGLNEPVNPGSPETTDQTKSLSPIVPLVRRKGLVDAEHPVRKHANPLPASAPNHLAHPMLNGPRFHLYQRSCSGRGFSSTILV